MKRSRARRLFQFLATMAGLLCLLALTLVLILRSAWFSDYLRRTIVQNVEHATQGRASIDSFAFDWRTLVVEIRGFTLDGAAPSPVAPFLHVPVLRLRLRIVSLLKRKLQVQSLIGDRPHLYIAVRADGTTNLPGPKDIPFNTLLQQFFDLRLPYIQATNGEARINEHRFRIDFAGDNVSLAMRYATATHQYGVSLRSPAIQLSVDKRPLLQGPMDVQAQAFRNLLVVTAAHLTSGKSRWEVSGTLRDFVSPIVDCRVQASMPAAEAARLLGVKGEYGGTVENVGTVHYDPRDSFQVDGNLTLRHLSINANNVRIQQALLRSSFHADAGALSLSKIKFETPAGRFSGHAELPKYKTVQVAGVVSGISLQTMTSNLLHKPLPWSGTISGPVELRGAISPRPEALGLNGSLTITPAAGGIPVAGEVRFNYLQSEGALLFQGSHFDLPNSHFQFRGDTAASLFVALDSANLDDLKPALALAGSSLDARQLPALLPGGSAHGQGTVHLSRSHPLQVEAAIVLAHFAWLGRTFDDLNSKFVFSPSALRIGTFSLASSLLQGSASGEVALESGQLSPSSMLRLTGKFTQANIDLLSRWLMPSLGKDFSGGVADGQFTLAGTRSALRGTAQVNARNLTVRGQVVNSLKATLAMGDDFIEVTRGEVHLAKAALAFGGTYRHQSSDWSKGSLQVDLDSTPFPLSKLHGLAPWSNDWNGQVEVHAKTIAAVSPQRIFPQMLEGSVSLRNIAFRNMPLGNLHALATTRNQAIEGRLTGDLRDSNFTGSSELTMGPGTPVTGELHMANITLQAAAALVQRDTSGSPPFSGAARADVTFDGLLEQPEKLHAVLQLQDLRLKGPALPALADNGKSSAAPEMILQNVVPVRVELAGGQALIKAFELEGKDTRFAVSGTASLLGRGALNLAVDGGVDLRLLQLLYPDLQIGGASQMGVKVSGTLGDPEVAGSVQLRNASLVSSSFPNALTGLNGRIQFDQHRASFQDLKGHTGGGQVTFAGFATYGANRPVVYRLDATGQNIRVRYAGGISVTGNSQLSLTGTGEQSLLAGGITLLRVVFNPSTDLGNLIALTSGAGSGPDEQSTFLSRLQMDVHVESAPNLQLDTALSSGVQAEVNLQLRGTPRQPIFLGTIEANEGDIKVFGGRYTINRGEVSFTNSVRIEPVLDLDLQTQARGITVDITVSGTPSKLNVNYRSDPPLQPREIIALLTIGRTPETTSNAPDLKVANDSSALQSGANTVLGQAISPVSNRLSKLFGITNIKIDPLVQGITNTPQARLTLEQQVSRQITVTYITNLSQTSEQIFRLEYALNRQFSLVALRDDNGEFGIDILFKKRFK